MHGSNHNHGTTTASNNIKVALFLNLGFAVVEIIGGLWTGSIAIISDAVHDLGDSMALLSAYVLEKLADREADDKYSYGYRRLSLLSALITISVLIAGSIWVVTEAIPRLFDPVMPKVEGMIVLAVFGTAVNGYAAWRVQKGSTLNEKAVSWHLIEDVLGWIAVLIVSVLMMFTDLPILDPILSLFITLIILFGVYKNFRKTIRLFLQGTPEEIELSILLATIESIDQVISTHDVHLWSLDGNSHVLTLHLVVKDDVSPNERKSIKDNVRNIICGFGKIHSTIEIESESDECGECATNCSVVPDQRVGITSPT